MKELSLLLALDGSLECKAAFAACHKLATKMPVRVTALHVIDSVGLWDFLCHDSEGLLGSGPFLMAHEQMKRALQSIGETLTDVYKIHADSSGIEGDLILDEGSTVREVYRRCQDFDMIAIGHRMCGVRSTAEERRKFPRYSAAEKLVHYVNRPLLVMQSALTDWAFLTLAVSADRLYVNAFAGAIQLAKKLSVPLRVTFGVQPGDEVDRIPSVVNRMRQSAGVADEFPVDVKIVRGDGAWFMPPIESASDSLVIVPTAASSMVRETPFSTAPDLVLRYSPCPAILFWPEEYSATGALQQEKVTIVAAGD
jgi:nucleotide-binding universal stress UspA family protein